MSRLDPQRDPAKAIKNGLYVEEPGQSFADMTLRRLEVRPKSSHILAGPSGTGRSTQLRILQRALNAHKDLVPVFVDAKAEASGFQRPGALSTLLATGVRDIVVAEQAGGDRGSRVVLATFLALASGNPSPSFLRLITKREHSRKLVLIVDSLDHLPEEVFTALCRQDLAELKTLVSVVIVGHQSVLQGILRDRAEGFAYPSYKCVHDPAQGGTAHAFSTQILAKSDDDLIPADFRARLADASGGSPRDLLELAQTAVENAYVAGHDQVERDDMDGAIAEFGKKHSAGLETDDLARLRRLYKTGAFAPTDGRDINLLATRRVLRYTNPTGARTFAVHPSLLPVIAPPDPLETLTASARRKVQPPTADPLEIIAALKSKRRKVQRPRGTTAPSTTTPASSAPSAATTTRTTSTIRSDSGHDHNREPADHLHRLLVSLFTSAEQFRQWVALGPNGQKLVTEFPSSSVSVSAAVFAGLNELRRHDYLDAHFFARLSAEFPRRRDKIDAVAARFVLSSPPEPLDAL